MQTSARNQFSGKVTAVKRGAVNDEVEIEIGAGRRIVAIVTHESTDHLGLAAGVTAVALIKSSAIILAADDPGFRFSARNQLKGAVSRVVGGAVNSEVLVDLGGGTVLTAIVTNESVKTLALRAGAQVSALFKASSVIVGVKV